MVFNFGPRPPAGQPVQQPVRAAPPTEMQQSAGFTEVLKQPEVQAALIQFGINMLNPTYDGFGGQLGRSIGAAGAAAGRAVGQKQERELNERKARLQEQELSLAERRVAGAEKRENRLASGKGLTSLFSKPKPFATVLQEMAEKRESATFGEERAVDLVVDPVFRDQIYQAWLQSNKMGANLAGGEGVAAGPPEPGTEEDGYRFLGGDPGDPANWEPL